MMQQGQQQPNINSFIHQQPQQQNMVQQSLIQQHGQQMVQSQQGNGMNTMTLTPNAGVSLSPGSIQQQGQRPGAPSNSPLQQAQANNTSFAYTQQPQQQFVGQPGSNSIGQQQQQQVLNVDSNGSFNNQFKPQNSQQVQVFNQSYAKPDLLRMNNGNNNMMQPASIESAPILNGNNHFEYVGGKSS